MISEQITVSTTPATIQQLIATAKGIPLANIPKKAIGTMMRVDVGTAEIVTLYDELGGGVSAAGAVVMNNAIDLLSTSIGDMVGIDKAYLACNTGTVTVHIIIAQGLK